VITTRTPGLSLEDRLWRQQKHQKYLTQISKIATACRKAKDLGDSAVVPVVPNQYSNGKIDLELTHRLVIKDIVKKFALRQVYLIFE
jgi:hypothetical protein